MSLPRPIEPLEIAPLTPDRWPDFERLFGLYGASSGCWCMYWRYPAGGGYTAGKGEPNKLALHAIVESGHVPGLLAYVHGIPAAWVAVSPRSEYPRLENSKWLYPVDGKPVWSIPCFFIHRGFRRQHLLAPMIHAAIEFARANGAVMVEAYPVDTQLPNASSNRFTGLLDVFKECGFEEVARRGDRPIVRKALQPVQPGGGVEPNIKED